MAASKNENMHNHSGRLVQIEAENIFKSDLSFWTDPKKIEKLIRKEFWINNDPMQHKDFFDFFIIDGDWDKRTQSVRDDRNFLEISDLLKFGMKFRDSESFNRCLLELERGLPQKDHRGNFFTTVNDVEDNFNFYLKLISDMKNNGYVKQSELPNGKQDTDIGVAVGRDGELIHFRRGHHRLAAAKQLRLDRVAVQVQLVHAQWVQKKIELHQCEEVTAIQLGLRSLSKEQNV